jgi:predicted DCC family thiol-disulfide oxidoreductase YuxK
MEERPIILFDGVCNFCNGSINFLIRQDKKDVFRFAPLQSQTGQKLLAQYQIQKKGFESFVLLQDGKAYQKSTAALKVLKQLPWYWKALKVFWIVPAFLRNSIYDFIARNRYKWFGKKETCMIPTRAVRNRFLD